MKSPIDVVKGRIVDYNPASQEITIKAIYPDWQMMIKREYAECEIRLVDGRTLSQKQRRMVYALLRAISDWSGQGVSGTKQAMKRKFLDEELGAVDMELFSLADAPVSLIASFQRYLIHFIIDYEVPCDFPLLDYVDDVNDYLYACLIKKKCCICGLKTELHHVDHVGIGRDRDEIIHEGMRALPLCTGHHIIAHTIGQQTFEEKHHLPHGVLIDKFICKIYGLKSNEED